MKNNRPTHIFTGTPKIQFLPTPLRPIARTSNLCKLMEKIIVHIHMI